MKYHDTEFPDGTEPTVRKLPLGCDQQGRYPQSAEPCADFDELGIRLPDKIDWLERAAVLVLGVFVVVVLALLGSALWRLA